MFGPKTPKMEGYPSYLSLNRAVELIDGFDKPADTFALEDGMGSTVALVPRSKLDLDVEGATYHEWLAAGEFDKAREYLWNDIALTRAVANANPFLG